MLQNLRKYDLQFYFFFRIIIGFVFFIHGTQKLFGWFGGHQVPAVISLFGVAGVIESVAGLAFMLGLFVRPIALITAVEMAIAYGMVHFPNSWNPLVNKGEPALLFFAAFLVLFAHGVGKWSLERAIWKKEHF